MARRRPNPVLWLYYQYGGTLPAKYREWVLHDGTCRTWFLRVALRAFVQLAPIMAVLVIILRGAFGWSVAAGTRVDPARRVGLPALRADRVSVDSVDSRLFRHGYPAGHGTTVRYQAAKARETKR